MASAPGGMVAVRAIRGDTTCGNAQAEAFRTEGRKVSWILHRIGKTLVVKPGLGILDLLMTKERLGIGATTLIGIKKQIQSIIRLEDLIGGKKT